MSSATRPSRGASHGKLSFGARIKAWWGHHKSTGKESFFRLWRTPMQTLMTTLVVAIALSLPAVFMVSLANMQALGERWDTDPKLSVFINVLAKEAAIEQLQQKIQAWPEIDSVEFVTPQQAVLEFQAVSGLGEVLQGLDENPLPPTLIITPRSNQISPEKIQAISDRLSEEAIVDVVQFDLEWVKRLQEIMALGEKVVLGLAALLSFGVLLAIGNTIRLEIENRREEIVVTKLVGGTDAFVRRPFMYAGALYGFLGGAVAVVIVSVGFASIQGSVERLSMAYNSEFQMHGLGFDGIVSLLAISALLGFFGAWLAVGRHLSDIEPN